ncbi:MAG: hypothetical protein DLM58_16445 [Pseudonocardiales bacterium]|nr:MAG: hypothetical protein DLM58_16445 [Pseudonocardiales bacterium]
MITDSMPDNPARRTCRHTPACPTADASDRDAAHVISAHPEQGWSLLCNGIVLFEDFGELLPNGQSSAARHSALASCSPHRQAS